jgi:hypothetical protein
VSSESGSPSGPGTPAPPAGQAQQARSQQIPVDDAQAVSSYANFCRVTGSPEELIVDFGLNSQATGVPQQPIAIRQRIIMNYYTAKRLLAALHMSVQRHEAAFGVLETDVQKRLQRAPGGQTGGPPPGPPRT